MALKVNIQLTREQQKLLGGALLLFVGGGYGYWTYFWQPVSMRIEEARNKLEQVESEIRTAESQAGRLDKLTKELELLNQQAQDAERRLPKTKDFPELLELLSRLAQRHKVDMSNMAAGTSSAKQYFTEISYQISLTGSYHDVGRFLAALALEERIFNVRNVTYAGGGAGGGDASAAPVLTVGFTLVTYQYKG